MDLEAMQKMLNTVRNKIPQTQIKNRSKMTKSGPPKYLRHNQQDNQEQEEDIQVLRENGVC
jgi:hypothetical protein